MKLTRLLLNSAIPSIASPDDFAGNHATVVSGTSNPGLAGSSPDTDNIIIMPGTLYKFDWKHCIDDSNVFNHYAVPGNADVQGCVFSLD